MLRIGPQELNSKDLPPRSPHRDAFGAATFANQCAFHSAEDEDQQRRFRRETFLVFHE